MSANEMDLRDLLLRVASTYDRSAKTTKGTPGQELLRRVSHMSLPLPIGTFAEGHGGRGGSAFCPWIGVFDPDINEKPREGLYLAYIFAKDLTSVTLTLQQGVEGAGATPRKNRAVHRRLRANAERLQAAMLQDALDGWRERPRLGVKTADWRPTAYEEASIAARRYEIPHLPAEADLRDDLWEAMAILQLAAAVDRETWNSEVEDQLPASTARKWVDQAPRKKLSGFRPKDDSDYRVHTPERDQVRTRRHETLIRAFGEYIQAQGFEADTEVHPRDLMLTSVGGEWLVEGKVVSAQNPTKAVREAVGQLFEYRHFYCRESNPYLLALFTEDIVAYADYLETLRIGSVWKTQEGWAGSRSAVEWGIVAP